MMPADAGQPIAAVRPPAIGRRRARPFIRGLVAALLLSACGLPGLRPPAVDPGLQAFMDRRLGADWYGVYLEQNKIGYFKSTASRGSGPGGPIYQLQLEGVLALPAPEDAGQTTIRVEIEFKAEPPFELLRYRDRTVRQGHSAEVAIEQTGQGYLARVTQGADTRLEQLGALGYTLAHYCAVQRWIARGPAVGDRIRVPYLNLQTLAIQENLSQISAVRTAVAAGVTVTYYDVATTGGDGLERAETFGADGKAYALVFGGVFECRLEPETLATQRQSATAVFFKNTVPIDRPLGDTARVGRLRLLLEAEAGNLLGSAPGQAVMPGPAGRQVLVAIDPASGPPVVARQQEIDANLAATTEFPARHPQVLELAREAAAGARTTADQVGRLVRFVRAYIQSDYTANPLTVLDIIAVRKGDCSEHARLFTVLARALGIPARTVGGLIYLGDTFQEFGLHAWNEVVIDGAWVPVDPTRGQTRIDAAHIRFPIDMAAEWQVMAAIPKIKLKVLEVEERQAAP